MSREPTVGPLVRGSTGISILWFGITSGVRILILNVIMELNIGQTFASFKELQSFIKEYEHKNFVNLTYRDAKTLEGRRKLAPNRVTGANTNLKYYSIWACCSFGGKKFTKKGENVRTDVSEQTGENGDSRAVLAVKAGTGVLDQGNMQLNILANLLAAEGETYSQELMQPSSSANESNAGKCAIDFGSIIMPPAKRCRGRPKGADLTVIGLRKAKDKSSQKSKLVPLNKLNAAEKDGIMLSWFVADEVKAKALAGSLKSVR